MKNKAEVPEDRILCSGWHWSFGWLRRPEMDEGNCFAYEDGDGDIVLSPYPHHNRNVYLDCMQDMLTGEKYLTFSVTPRVYAKTRGKA